MSRNGQEVIYESWLTKSPPTNRIWRGRWRKRWFVLHSGELPNQFILSYYTDRSSRRLKGFINLDHCEQVDTGLKFVDKKQKFDYMFDIKTPTRTYYLAAESEVDMKAWVKCICNVCGLKATSDEDDCKFEEVAHIVNAVESPPVSPVSTDPYIMISECISGNRPLSPNQPVKFQDFDTLLQHNMKASYFRSTKNQLRETYETPPPTYLNCDPRFYDIPRRLQPPPKLSNLDKTKSNDDASYSSYQKNVNPSPLQSPTDSGSVFTDDDWPHDSSAEHSKLHRPSNSSLENDSSKLNTTSEISPIAPPRPPKPSHITTSCYLNLQTELIPNSKPVNHSKSNSLSEEITQPILISDEMYDFPRSQTMDKNSVLGRRHCYNNAAPSNIEPQVFTYDNTSPKPGTSNAQIYQFGDELDEPASPLSQSSSIVQYSNLPSPLLLPDSQLMPPPKVNRGLKPKRKLSDSHSIASSTEPPSPHYAPSVDRKLKPTVRSGTLPTPSRRGFDSDENMQKVRAAPSPMPPNLRRSFESLLIANENEQIYHQFPFFNQRKIIEYLDLDLDNKAKQAYHSATGEPIKSPGAITVYKKVDFVMTKAFNMTKESRERTKQENKST